MTAHGTAGSAAGGPGMAAPAQAGAGAALPTRVLVVGSASAANVTRAVDAVLALFERAEVTVAAPRDVAATLRLNGRRAAVVPDATVGSVRRMTGYDVKVGLFTGEGHSLLKLATFLAPAPRMLVFTEGGGMFAWTFDDRLAIWNHVRWRLSGGGPLPAQVARLARAVVNPIIALAAFVVLLWWHGRLWLRRRRTEG